MFLLFYPIRIVIYIDTRPNIKQSKSLLTKIHAPLESLLTISIFNIIARHGDQNQRADILIYKYC